MIFVTPNVQISFFAFIGQVLVYSNVPLPVLGSKVVTSAVNSGYLGDSYVFFLTTAKVRHQDRWPGRQKHCMSDACVLRQRT